MIAKVGADGSTSLVRKHSNIDCITHDYQQRGVVATLCFSEVKISSICENFNNNIFFLSKSTLFHKHVLVIANFHKLYIDELVLLISSQQIILWLGNDFYQLVQWQFFQ